MSKVRAKKIILDQRVRAELRNEIWVEIYLFFITQIDMKISLFCTFGYQS